MNIPLAFFCLFIGLSQNMAQENSKTFRWPNNCEAAVCLTYDNGLDCHLDIAAPALDSFGLRGTFIVRVLLPLYMID